MGGETCIEPENLYHGGLSMYPVGCPWRTIAF